MIDAQEHDGATSPERVQALAAELDRPVAAGETGVLVSRRGVVSHAMSAPSSA